MLIFFVIFNRMETVLCQICHEGVKVPVYFTCFPCGSHNRHGIQCNSIGRVCLLCAREYLQLNRPSHERIHTRKCLTCNAVVNLTHLKALNAYKKDYMLMSLDHRKTIPCFHTECSFQGTQNELERHQRDECHFRFVRCQHCHVNFQLSTLEDHKKTCRGCVVCDICLRYIVKSHFDDHLLNVHQRVKCCDCKAIIETKDIDNHRSECPMRKVQCCICRTGVCFGDMKNHCLTHFHETLICIERANAIIHEKTQVLHELHEMLDTLSLL